MDIPFVRRLPLAARTDQTLLPLTLPTAARYLGQPIFRARYSRDQHFPPQTLAVETIGNRPNVLKRMYTLLNAAVTPDLLYAAKLSNTNLGMGGISASVQQPRHKQGTYTKKGTPVCLLFS